MIEIDGTLRFAILCLLALIASGCDIRDTAKPPYAITKPVSVTGIKAGYYSLAGIEFTIYNETEKEIQAIGVSCMIYDAETKKNPLIGSNSLHFNSRMLIPPNGSQALALSLDPYVYSVPKTPWLIDFMYISSIDYSDGSSWQDSTGTYYSRSY